MPKDDKKMRPDVVAKARMQNATVTQWTGYTGWGEPQIPRVGDRIVIARDAKSLQLYDNAGQPGNVLIEDVDGNVYELWGSQMRIFANEFTNSDGDTVAVDVVEHPDNPRWKAFKVVEA